jgi:hypothetical protein
MELQVSDEWAVEVENETDHILTLTHDNGAGTLQLSLPPNITNQAWGCHS